MTRQRKYVEGSSSDSRQRLVETASRLLRVQGYHATGLNQVVEESQAPKGSLYHYFPEGKEQLAAEALRCAGKDLGGRLRQVAQLPPGEGLQLLVEASIQDLIQSDYHDGCPIATVALECPQLGPVCDGIFQQALGLLEEMLQRRGYPDAKELALTIFSAYEGALMLCKVRRSPEPLQQVARQLLKWLQPSG